MDAAKYRIQRGGALRGHEGGMHIGCKPRPAPTTTVDTVGGRVRDKMTSTVSGRRMCGVSAVAVSVCM